MIIKYNYANMLNDLIDCCKIKIKVAKKWKKVENLQKKWEKSGKVEKWKKVEKSGSLDTLTLKKPAGFLGGFFGWVFWAFSKRKLGFLGFLGFFKNNILLLF